MPLIPNQKETIKNSVGHFFIDLPTEENALRNSVKDFRLAWLNRLPPEHELAAFQKCIHQPRRYLRNLETNNENITEAEVLRYLFNFTTRNLVRAVKKIGLSLSQLDFQASSLLTPLIQYKTPFVTLDFGFERVELIDFNLVAPPGRIYKGILKSTRGIWELTLTLATEPTITRKMVLENFRYDQTDMLVEDEAKKIILELLTLDQVNLSDSAKILLTYSFYFQLMQKGMLSLNLIANITPFQLETLTMPNLMERYDIPTLLSLTEVERKIFLDPFYSAKLAAKKYNFHRDFAGIDDAACFNLIFPPSIYLLREDREDNVLISQLKAMSKHVRTILANEFYVELIKHDLMRFDVIQEADETFASDLNNPIMMKLISDKIINPNQLTPHIARLIVSNLLLQKFVELHILKVSDLSYLPAEEKTGATSILPNKLSPLEIKRIRAKFSSIIKFLENDFFNPQTFQAVYIQIAEGCLAKRNYNFLEYADLVRQGESDAEVRLQALLSDRPATLNDGSIDSFERLRKNCEICRINFEKILDNEIERRLDASSSSSAKNGLEPILANRDALKVSDLRIKAIYFGQRLMKLYDPGSRSSSDCFEKLAHDIRETDLPNLRNAVIRRFLLLLKADLSEKIPNEESFLNKMVKEIDKVEKNSLEAEDETARLACWEKGFAEIVAIAKDERKSLKNPDSYLIIIPQRDAKRQRISSEFFVEEPRITSSGGMKEFCDRLIQLNERMQFGVGNSCRAAF